MVCLSNNKHWRKAEGIPRPPALKAKEKSSWEGENGFTMDEKKKNRVRECHFLSLREKVTHFYQLEKLVAAGYKIGMVEPNLTLLDLKGYTHGSKMSGEKNGRIRLQWGPLERTRKLNHHTMLRSKITHLVTPIICIFSKFELFQD